MSWSIMKGCWLHTNVDGVLKVKLDDQLYHAKLPSQR